MCNDSLLSIIGMISISCLSVGFLIYLLFHHIRTRALFSDWDNFQKSRYSISSAVEFHAKEIKMLRELLSELQDIVRKGKK